MHILQGRRLLANIEDRKTPEIDIIRQYLAPIYSRLAYVGNDRVNFPTHLLQMTTTPLKFASLADARCVLYYLVDIGFTLIYDVKSYRSNGVSETPDTQGDAMQSRYKQIAHELANWRHAFEARARYKNRQASDTETLSHDSVPRLDGLGYDNEIMQGPSFTFESEVVGPVYWIAAKCRQPAIRGRALEFLYEREKMNRVESLTMLKHTIVMAKRVIEIEEEGLDIPHGTRPMQDYPNKYEVVSREESSEWAESFLTDQKEQWPVLWDLGSHCSDIPTRLTRIAAATEQKELAEGLAKGWPTERLVWPYGITRERRVLSVVVKRHTVDDPWLEYVREPLTGGGDYRVMKEHIRFT
ncbi:hypothetical protein FVEG_05742 [Fusarium verticillioides 7600]|uniref:Uncharacterized protein n=1 Tax=Gibberella moniliformis (strain M3125 / FGSC 7600) TaxID=334819 RepID=W7LZL1_GIBM7|nr:hypothetical protein FVEG_05742 [Fusarium verticillioides 7600]EWG44748.1 hypothetical protein FVEG_05742 [Fusarium verticillioides 7600]